MYRSIHELGCRAKQLYNSDSSGSTIRIGTVGTGLPTTSGQTITNLQGIPAASGSPYAFFLADLSAAVDGRFIAFVPSTIG